MVKRIKSVSDGILAKLTKPKSKDFDVEDEDFNYKKSSNSDSDNNDESEEDELEKRDHYVKLDKSKIRDTSINLGSKYKGSKVGRDELYDDQEQIGIDNENDDNIDNIENESYNGDDNDRIDIQGKSKNKRQGGGLLDDVTDSEEDEEDEAESDKESINGNSASEDYEEESYKLKKISKLLQSEKQQILSRLSTSAKTDALKGYIILRQTSEFDRILDTRIKLQKAMVSANSLPVNKMTYKEYKTEDTENILKQTEDQLHKLVEKLTRLRSKQLYTDKLIKKEPIMKVSRKRSLSEYIESNKQLDEISAPIRKQVLSKWSNRVQSASGLGALNQGKFKVINQNIWTQVSNNLNDLDRLVKKTKINRRHVTPLGYTEETNINPTSYDDQNESENEEERLSALTNVDKSLQVNQYIFDDDDFYRLLLNDMINKKLDQKQANSSAILMLSSNKMKKSYDRMSTKGRKLKYNIQEPLVQFEVPKHKQYGWGDDQIDELFAGLFGMKIRMDDVDEERNDVSDGEDIGALKSSSVKLFG